MAEKATMTLFITSFLLSSQMLGALFICYLNTFLTWISNGLLIFLIIRKSPKSMGNYKYLMLSFASFALIFGISEITNQAFLHFYQGCNIVFSLNPLGLPRWISFWYIGFNKFCFLITLSLLVFHFLYRYFAVCKPHLLYLFSWPYCSIFMGSSVFVSFGCYILEIMMAGESESTDKYIAATMLQTYGLKKGDYTYVATVFYRTDPKTFKEHLSISDLANNAITGAVINFGFSVIFHCWFKIRYQLMKAHQNQSQKTLEMQRQLFKCLISQTLLPVFFLFIPASTVIIFPILKLEPGPSENIIFPLITTQPFLDAIVPMYFITEYRRTILRFFGKKYETSRIFNVSSTGSMANK